MSYLSKLHEHFVAPMVLAVAVIIASMCSASAQDAVSTVVDFKPLVDLGLRFLAAIIGVLGAWAIARVMKLLGVQSDNALGERLNLALEKAIAYGAGAVGAKLDGHLSIDVKNEIVASASRYAVDKVPDTIAHFSITPQKLAEMLHARLPA